MSHTPLAPDMDALPPGGGSYTRLPDGSLLRNDAPEQAGHAGDPSSPPHNDPQE